MQSRDYCDLGVICGSKAEEVHLHRAIVCPQTPAFSKACSPEFHGEAKITFTSPSNIEIKPNYWPPVYRGPYENAIILFGVEQKLFQLVVDFLYTGNYFDGEHPVIDNTPSSAALIPEQAVSKSLLRPRGVPVEPSRSSPATSCTSLDLGYGEIPAHEGPDTTASQQHLPLDPEDEELLRRDIIHEFNDADPASSQHSADTNESGSLDTSYPHAMFTNLRLYMVAHALGIEPLKLLARERFFMSCVRHIEHEDFPKVIDELYTTTAADDVIMRDLPCRLIAPRMRLFEDSFKDRMEPIMHKHGILATGVMNYIIYSSYSRVIGVGAANSDSCS